MAKLLIDRVFPEPIGRVHMSSGTHDVKAKADIEKMLSAFAESVPPRYDLLEAIKAKRIGPMYALSLWRQGNVQLIPLADSAPKLGPLDGTVLGAAGRWLLYLRCSPEYRASIKTTLRALLRINPEASFGELPQLVRLYRDECQQRSKYVQFNRAKSHVMAMIRDELRPSHALYAAVQDVARLDEAPAKEKRPQTPRALYDILQLLPAERRLEAWSMAATGMGQKEYWGKWRVLADRIHIEGTKRDSRVRDVPRWTSIVKPAIGRAGWEDEWQRCIGDKLDIYNLRRSFIVWLEEAGIAASRQWMYSGHAAPTQTEEYKERELTAWLVGDGKKLREYVERDLRGEAPSVETFAAAMTDVLADHV